MRVLGLDPGLRQTGWGIILAEGSRLRHVANGVVNSTRSQDLASRLLQLQDGLLEVIDGFRPDAAAVEITLANKNAASTLKLGMARGVALLAPAMRGLPVGEYLPMIVKKSVVGSGHADKQQVAAMVTHLLPGCEIAAPDAADALAVAICHAHNLATERRWSAGQAAGQAGGGAVAKAGR